MWHFTRGAKPRLTRWLRRSQRGRIALQRAVPWLVVLPLIGSPATVSAATVQPIDYTRLFPHVFTRKGPPLREVALTFDDGPDNVYTPQILAILQREHVKATFFIVGQQAERHPQMMARIVRAGHAIGNHTFDHPDLARISLSHMNWEVTRTERDIARLTGQPNKWVRPPYGSVNARVLAAIGRMGYQAVNWSVDSNDWQGLSAAQIEHNIVGSVFPGAIILQHCAGSTNENLKGTVAALPVVIHALRARGYSFVTVPELLDASDPHEGTHCKTSISDHRP